MSDIFISYAREDKDRVTILANALQAHGWSVWWDPHIRTGKRFDQVIEEALAEARCIIVVWSTHSISSLYVLAEANEGANRQVLLPVMIEEVKIPLIFRQIQTAHLVDWQGSPQDPEFEKLVEDIEVMLGMPPILPKAAAGSSSDVRPPIAKRAGLFSKNAITIRKSNFGSRLKVLGAVVAAALLVGLVVWAYYSPSNQGPTTTNVNLATPTPQVSPTASPQPSVTIRDLSDLAKHIHLTRIAFYQGPCSDAKPQESILNANMDQANLSQTRWFVEFSFPRLSYSLEFVVVLKFHDSQGKVKGIMTKRNAYIEPGWDTSWHCGVAGLDRGGSLPKGSYDAKVYIGPSPDKALEVGGGSINVY